MISFSLDEPNQLLLNPRFSEHEKLVLNELKKIFETEFGLTGYFLIASSGSSKKITDSAKLVALSVQSVLNSAERVNNYLRADSRRHWGQVLPDYHVAGLGIKARAFLAQAKIFEFSWAFSDVVLQIEKNKISYISLVPAQIFDLVENKVSSPLVLQKVFVGGGVLSQELRLKIISLGWPVVETYGMTETSSMIAIRDKTNFFEVLPGVQIKNEAAHLYVRCNSVPAAILQKKKDLTFLQKIETEAWLQTEDVVNIVNSSSFELIGRSSDYIKILGEGVSLAELKDQLSIILTQYGISSKCVEIVALSDSRRGFYLVLVFEKNIDINIVNAVFNEFNLKVRPFEKLLKYVCIDSIPRTDLGKLKIDELKSILNQSTSLE